VTTAECEYGFATPDQCHVPATMRIYPQGKPVVPRCKFHGRLYVQYLQSARVEFHVVETGSEG
jgi:hypothetical protein